MYAFPPRNRRTVEGMPILKLVRIDCVSGKRYVLFLTPGISKAKVNEFHLVVLYHFQYVGYRHFFLQARVAIYDEVREAANPEKKDYISRSAPVTLNKPNALPRPGKKLEKPSVKFIGDSINRTNSHACGMRRSLVNAGKNVLTLHLHLF
jgi:hypothetical protein